MPSSPENSDATTNMIMPKLGLTMTEGLVAEWKVRPGDSVRAGDVVFVVETDKIANEIEAPSDGEIVEILAGEGDTVAVGAPVARWTGSGMAGTDGEPAAPVGDKPAVSRAQAPAEKQPPLPAKGDRVIATPLARRLARQHDIDIAAVPGSGPRGRIKAADVDRRLAETSRTPGGAQAETGSDAGRRVAVTSKQLAIAKRVTEAKRDTPHFYVSRPAEVSALIDLRARLNATGGPKITLTHFILKAVGRALGEVPQANRIWDGDGLLEFAAADVGMVVDTDDGLFIPILRDVTRKPIDRIAIEANAAADRARAGRLAREEIAGGAISVSNLGMGGVTSVAPILSTPHSATLGVGAVSELFRPDAAGEPMLRRELHLTLSCDHRVHDGMTGARVLAAIAHGLENPYTLLLTGSL